MPSLKYVMQKLGAEIVAAQQTPEEMLKMAELLNMALGGKDLRKGKTGGN